MEQKMNASNGARHHREEVRCGIAVLGLPSYQLLQHSGAVRESPVSDSVVTTDSIVNESVDTGRDAPMPNGVGKSSLCARFVLPGMDDFQDLRRDLGSSELSKEQFESPVVNRDHFLYFGTATRTSVSRFSSSRNRERSKRCIRFHVVEQTTLIDSSTREAATSRTPLPFAGCPRYIESAVKQSLKTQGRSHKKHSCLGPIQDSDELIESHKLSTLAEAKVEKQAVHVEEFPDDFTVDGFVLVFDPLKQGEEGALQVDLLRSIVRQIRRQKKSKPISLAVTKSDTLSPSGQEALKTYGKVIGSNKNPVPLFFCSPEEGIGVDAPFVHIATQRMQKLGRGKMARSNRHHEVTLYDTLRQRWSATLNKTVVGFLPVVKTLGLDCNWNTVSLDSIVDTPSGWALASVIGMIGKRSTRAVLQSTALKIQMSSKARNTTRSKSKDRSPLKQKRLKEVREQAHAGNTPERSQSVDCISAAMRSSDDSDEAATGNRHVAKRLLGCASVAEDEAVQSDPGLRRQSRLRRQGRVRSRPARELSIPCSGTDSDCDINSSPCDDMSTEDKPERRKGYENVLLKTSQPESAIAALDSQPALSPGGRARSLDLPLPLPRSPLSLSSCGESSTILSAMDINSIEDNSSASDQIMSSREASDYDSDFEFPPPPPPSFFITNPGEGHGSAGCGIPTVNHMMRRVLSNLHVYDEDTNPKYITANTSFSLSDDEEPCQMFLKPLYRSKRRTASGRSYGLPTLPTPKQAASNLVPQLLPPPLVLEETSNGSPADPTYCSINSPNESSQSEDTRSRTQASESDADELSSPKPSLSPEKSPLSNIMRALKGKRTRPAVEDNSMSGEEQPYGVSPLTDNSALQQETNGEQPYDVRPFTENSAPQFQNPEEPSYEVVPVKGTGTLARQKKLGKKGGTNREEMCAPGSSSPKIFSLASVSSKLFKNLKSKPAKDDDNMESPYLELSLKSDCTSSLRSPPKSPYVTHTAGLSSPRLSSTWAGERRESQQSSQDAPGPGGPATGYVTILPPSTAVDTGDYEKAIFLPRQFSMDSSSPRPSVPDSPRPAYVSPRSGLNFPTGVAGLLPGSSATVGRIPSKQRRHIPDFSNTPLYTSSASPTLERQTRSPPPLKCEMDLAASRNCKQTSELPTPPERFLGMDMPTVPKSSTRPKLPSAPILLTRGTTDTECVDLQVSSLPNESPISMHSEQQPTKPPFEFRKTIASPRHYQRQSSPKDLHPGLPEVKPSDQRKPEPDPSQGAEPRPSSASSNNQTYRQPPQITPRHQKGERQKIPSYIDSHHPVLLDVPRPRSCPASPVVKPRKLCQVAGQPQDNHFVTHTHEQLRQCGSLPRAKVTEPPHTTTFLGRPLSAHQRPRSATLSLRTHGSRSDSPSRKQSEGSPLQGTLTLPSKGRVTPDVYNLLEQNQECRVITDDEDDDNDDNDDDDDDDDDNQHSNPFHTLL